MPTSWSLTPTRTPDPPCQAEPGEGRYPSLGLFRKDGVYFPMEDLDFSGLEEVFRERFFEMLLRREKILPETVEKFKSWDHSGFSAGWDRKMKIIAAIAREQEDVIERILRHLHLWDPPWKRQRKVRGPPPSSIDRSAPSPTDAQRCEETFEAEAIDPTIDDELYAVDPVPPDDEAPT